MGDQLKSSIGGGPLRESDQIDGAFYESNQQQLSEISREDILRQVFGDVGDLIDDFSCAVETTVLLHGRMYVTSRFLCFYSNLFGLEKKIRIPYSHITQITKENTVLVIPNAIAITTYRKEYLFRSFWDRDECYRILKDFIDSYRNGAQGRRSNGVPIVNNSALDATAGSAINASSLSAENALSAARADLDEDCDSEDGPLVEDDNDNDDDDSGEEALEESDEDEDSGFSVVAGPEADLNIETMTPEQLLSAFREEESRSRLKIVVTSGTMPLSVAEFAALFVEDGAEQSWLVYHELVHDTSLELSPWAGLASTQLGMARELKFFKPVNLPGLKSTRGVKVQRYRRFGDAGLIVCSSTRLEDVPAADTFSVEDMVSVHQLQGINGEALVHVEITFEVHFLKTTMFKYLIERNTQSEMLKWLEAFYAHVNKCAIDFREHGPKIPLQLAAAAVAAAESAQRRRSASEGAKADLSKIQSKRSASNNKADERGVGTVLARLVGAGGRVFWAAWMLLFLALLFCAWQWKGVNLRIDRVNTRLDELLEAQTRIQQLLEKQCPVSRGGASKR